MRPNIHPNYVLATVSCACGYQFQTRSTRSSYQLEICSNCHPFFTGKQKLVDSAGRVERFAKKFQKTGGKTVRSKAKTRVAKVSALRKMVRTTAARKVKPEKKAK